jgi:uncharacterized membrane protein YphA (DoxX/SURF4 family)
MGTLLVGARVLLVVVFSTAGVAKLLDQRGTRRALAGFRVPARARRAAAIVLPVAELGTAIALLFPSSARWGGLAALFLLIAFAGGIAKAMRDGRAPDCHCFGQLHSAPAGRGTLLRNLALAVPAAFVAVEGPGPSLSAWVADRTAAELVAIAAAVAALVLGVLAARFWRESVTLRRDLDDARKDLEGVPPGLPVGSIAPEFGLRSARTGETVTLDALRALGRPVALVFVSPSCGSCTVTFQNAGRWQHALASDLTVAIVSDGEPGENLVVVQDSSADVLLQEDFEVGTAYRVAVTPTLVMVSPDGHIASALVAGPGIEPQIRLTIRENATGPVGAAAAVQRVA